MLLIKNGRIYTMEDQVIENGSILIEDGRIKELGEGDIQVEGEVRVIDAGGRLVTPGFIDAHSHIGLSEDSIGFEGRDHNERVNPITPHMRVIDGINPRDRTLKEAYEGGVTAAMASPGSANLIGGQTAVIKTYGHRVDDMIVKEPAAIKAALGENPKRVYSSQKKSPATRMASAALIREALIKAKSYNEKKEVDQDLDFDMVSESLLPVVRREIPLKIHAHRSDDIFTAIRIARELDIDLTLDHCTDGSLIAEDLAREDYPVIVGPSLGHRSKLELRNKSFKTAKLLADQGLKLAITTDSPVIPLHHLPLCAAMAHGEGLDEMEAFKAITINPAEIAGVADRIGSIKPGKDADILIIEGHPLKQVNYKIHTTIIDGQIVYQSEDKNKEQE